jgi:phage tail-like protein
MDVQTLLQLLPLAFRDAERRAPAGSPLAALLSVLEGLLQPVDDVISDLHRHVDPRTSPEPLLPLLASWLCDSWVACVDASCEREQLASFARFSAQRGTRRALCHALRLVSGCRDIRIEESTSVPFHFSVTLPEALRSELGRLERTLELYKPAHTTAELRFVAREAPPAGSAS